MTERHPGRNRIRRITTGLLVVVGTAAIAFCAVDAAPFGIRAVALLLAVTAATASIVLSARRANLAGWYLIAALAAGTRIVLGLLGGSDR